LLHFGDSAFSTAEFSVDTDRTGTVTLTVLAQPKAHNYVHALLSTHGDPTMKTVQLAAHTFKAP